MSLARKHRERTLASQMASAPAMEGGLSLASSAAASDAGTPAGRAAASIAMRLQHDLRRLKDIQSIARRVEVKREMLPAYTDWVAGLLDGGRNAGAGIAEDVLPTVMVWLIDTGDYDGKALRKIMAIRLKAKEEFQEEEAILETYLQALGMI